MLLATCSGVLPFDEAGKLRSLQTCSLAAEGFLCGMYVKSPSIPLILHEDGVIRVIVIHRYGLLLIFR